MDTQPNPVFPNFKALTLNDRSIIEHLLQDFLPYSDFNFTNLWSWDVLESRKFTTLHGNLVVLFTDYRTNTSKLSFLGLTHPDETANTLLSYAQDIQLGSVLTFIPETTAQRLNQNDFIVEEDYANHDYIFSVENIAFPKSKKMKNKRRLANTFAKNSPHIQVTQETLTNPATQQQILSVLYCWEQNKQLSNKSYEIIYEEIALRRLLGSAGAHNLVLTCLYDGVTMIAFSIDEILPKQYALSHFIKADIRYRGIYEFLNQVVAHNLLENGVQFWNWEQDLNLEGLRMLKNSYQPVHFLKKFIITKN